MSDIDFESLHNAVMENIDERLWNNYDFDIVLKSARIVWDGTAVQVESKDFSMIFDLVDYSLLDYEGFDVN